MGRCRTRIWWNLQKTIFFFFFHLNMRYSQVINSIGLDFTIKLFIKWYSKTWKSPQWYLGDAEQESGVISRKRFDYIFLWIFLNMWYTNVNSICHDFVMQLLQKLYSKTWKSPQWYLGRCIIIIIIIIISQVQQEETQMQNEWNKYLFKYKFRGVHGVNRFETTPTSRREWCLQR